MTGVGVVTDEEKGVGDSGDGEESTRWPTKFIVTCWWIRDKKTASLLSLASCLNDLAAAHAQQLITYVFIVVFTAQLTLPSDDDYRLLRQDLFQKYSNEQLSLPKTPSDCVANYLSYPVFLAFSPM